MAKLNLNSVFRAHDMQKYFEGYNMLNIHKLDASPFRGKKLIEYRSPFTNRRHVGSIVTKL